MSEELRNAASDIPWALNKGMRNRLIHVYSDVNVGLVWSTVVSDLQVLIAQLEDLLRDE